MSKLSETVINSLRDILSGGIKALPGLIIAIIVILATRYLAQIVTKLAKKVGESSFKSYSLRLLLEKTGYIGTWILGGLVASVVAFPGLDPGDIIAALGLGSVAIGFAFQDIFKNFLAGILLLLQEPFKLGDQIIVESYEGTVEAINFRTTQIRTYQGERILVPNATVFTSAVQVRTAFGCRRTDLAVGVDYNTPLPKAREILEQAIQSVDGVLTDPEPEIDLVSFGDSSIDLIVRYWTQPEQKAVRQTQTQAILSIKQCLDRADINIPYPIRTVYFYNQDKYSDFMPGDRDGMGSHAVEAN